MRQPLLMMRTRGLSGPLFGKHMGNRASHPLAHSQGSAVSAGIVIDGLGPELITNGSFTGNADGWILGDGRAYGNNNAVATAATNNLQRGVPTGTFVDDGVYQVIYTVSGYTTGQFRARLYNSAGFTGLGVTHAANGTYIENITITAGAAATDQFRIITVTAPLSMTVDNVSVREVL